ncbi:MAG: T9SS type A sorting domain-containing protein [Bacteroidetes bacterium]|nr:T9SS type A sorting domain-containing protein [Bacteroidota bacterium]
MKKIFLILLSVVSMHFNAFSQTVMQASLGAGTTSTRVKIYVRPQAPGMTGGNISTFQFNIAIPSSVSPAPTLAFVAPPVFGSGWVITPSYVEDGFRHYEIVSATAGPLVLATNTELEVMEVEFTGGPGGFNNVGVSLYTLPAGGATGNAVFLCTGLGQSFEGQLYYARPGVTVVNNNSYTGGLPSSATLSGVLPVTFSGYDVKCNDKGVSLTWSTATEQNSDKFEIQRSDNGTDWYVVGSVPAAGNSNFTRNYNYLDLKGGSGLYRIRQVDIDGQYIYTGIKRTTCSTGQIDVVLYPVPAKDNLTVVIKSDKSIRTDLRILDMTGKVVRIIPTQINNGNNTVNLNVSNLASGQYILGSSDPALELNNKFTILR